MSEDTEMTSYWEDLFRRLIREENEALLKKLGQGVYKVELGWTTIIKLIVLYTLIGAFLNALAERYV